MIKEELLELFMKYNDASYNDNRIYKKHYEELIENILVKAERIKIQYATTIAELEAKTYTYEKIIANSNFASILKENKKKEEKNKNEKRN